jgi:pimeloyl-ACP methyl ester carboxylesterase
MTHQLQAVTLPGGLTLPYVEHGDPAGVPVVLLHGYSDPWRSWELLLPELPDSPHAFAVTQRGHGDADRPAVGYRPEDHAAAVAAAWTTSGSTRPSSPDTPAAATAPSASPSITPSVRSASF